MKCGLCKKKLEDTPVKHKRVLDNDTIVFCSRLCVKSFDKNEYLKLNQKIYRLDEKTFTRSKNIALSIIKTLIEKYNYSLNGKTIDQVNIPDSNFYGIKWSNEEKEKVIFYTTKKEVYKTYK